MNVYLWGERAPENERALGDDRALGDNRALEGFTVCSRLPTTHSATLSSFVFKHHLFLRSSTLLHYAFSYSR